MKSAFEHPSGGRVYGKDGGIFLAFWALMTRKSRHGRQRRDDGVQSGLARRSERVHAKALELGGSDEGAPGKRGPGFYFSYFRDLDGNKLCAYHIG